MAATASGRAISISIRPAPGSMSRSSGRTGSTCLRFPACPPPRAGEGGGGGALAPEPLFRKGTLAEPGTSRGRQAVGTVKLHPNGRFAYVANRASSTDQAGVFVGGENNLAVFAIDSATGEPSLIQHVDTRGIHCRNFHIAPSGRLL